MFQKCYVLLIIVLVVVSCQSNHSAKNVRKNGRVVANNQIFGKFLSKVASGSKTSTVALERAILDHIGAKGSKQSEKVWLSIGITEDQAKRISSLSDDMPYMDKVRKWTTENITSVSVANQAIKKGVATEAFESVISQERKLINPYRTLSLQDSRANMAALRGKQSQTSPLVSTLQKKQARVIKTIENIDDAKLEKTLKKNLAVMQNRGIDTPSIHANGLESIESAAIISRKTGIKSMGEGCESFNKKASSEVLEAKANIDIYRAKLIADQAEAKAGRSFASVSEIKQAERLTLEEVDDITVRSFEDVLGYTNVEAKAALKRLKQKPCRLY